MFGPSKPRKQDRAVGSSPQVVSFACEHKGPIGAAAVILGHRHSDRGHVWTEQVGPMAGTFLPEVHRVGKGLLSRGNIFGGNLGMIAGARRAILCRGAVGAVVTDPAPGRLGLGESRASSTRAVRPLSSRKPLTAASAFCGSSGCTGRAAYSGDTSEMEQPLNGLHQQGIRNSATAGVASNIVTAITMLRRIIPSR